MNHSNESPAKALDRGMGTVPMAASNTPPVACPLVIYLTWLCFMVITFGVALYAIWSVSL